MRFLQRTIDVTVATVALVLLTPVLLVIAAVLRLAGTRSVLHTEARVGRFGRHFPIHKFRSMHADSPLQPSVAAADDPRITKLGRFLRRWRLDELPQFYEVLVGHMSLVGPRPQTAQNLEAIDTLSLERLQTVRPGITGPAAVAFLAEDEALAGLDDPVDTYRRILLPEKIRLELDYLEHWSVLRDLQLLLLTLARVFSRRARRRSHARISALIRGTSYLTHDPV